MGRDGDVEPDRQTYTLAELTVEVDAPRWRGVPITPRSGKAVGRPATEVRLVLHPVEGRPAGLLGELLPAEIRISLSPEHLAVDLDINGDGDPFDLERVTLDAAFGGGKLSVYGEVLAGILEGDDLLTVRGDLAEQCWRIVDEVLKAWRDGSVPRREPTLGASGRAPDRGREIRIHNLGQPPHSRLCRKVESRSCPAHDRVLPLLVVRAQNAGDARPQCRHRGREAPYALALRPPGLRRPVRMVAVLGAPVGVDDRGLHVAVLGRADPDLAPRWRYRERCDALERLRIGHGSVPGVAIAESPALPTTTDARLTGNAAPQAHDPARASRDHRPPACAHLSTLRRWIV